MELKLFTDLLDALGKIADGLKSIVNLPMSDGGQVLQRHISE